MCAIQKMAWFVQFIGLGQIVDQGLMASRS